MNKCLVCWKGHHCSIYCTEYRPKVRSVYESVLRRKYTRFNDSKSINSLEDLSSRQKFERQRFISKKLLLFTHSLLKSKEESSQTDEALFNSRNEGKKQSKAIGGEVVVEWPHYMSNFNIPKH